MHPLHAQEWFTNRFQGPVHLAGVIFCLTLYHPNCLISKVQCIRTVCILWTIGIFESHMIRVKPSKHLTKYCSISLFECFCISSQNVSKNVAISRQKIHRLPLITYCVFIQTCKTVMYSNIFLQQIDVKSLLVLFLIQTVWKFTFLPTFFTRKVIEKIIDRCQKAIITYSAISGMRDSSQYVCAVCDEQYNEPLTFM